MLKKNLTPFENAAERRKIQQEAQKGKGVYEYQNISKSHIQLPKEGNNGETWLNPNQKFEGDDYFFKLVHAGELKCLRNVTNQENARIIMENKLLLDQPDRITADGKVEYVVKNGKKTLNEANPPLDATKKQPVLINEDPLEGVEIMTD